MTTPTLDLAIITGLSGAGRSTAAKCLEDLGWFVVDNLPPGLLSTMAELGHRSGGAVSRIAVVVDVRGRAFFSDLRAAVAALDARGMHPRMLFLEASDDALIRRFDHVRRPHPLQGDGRVVDGIGRERALLAELRGEADLVLDTTDLNVHELRSKIDAAFGLPTANRLNATVVSFGYKYGLPLDADLVADCRFLPNPHWVEELRPYTGRDPQVRDYVLAQPGAAEFLDQYAALLRLVGDGYAREGKRYLTLAVGCTGGKHRSVAMAEQLGVRLAADGVGVRVVHRDLGRE
ncbi:GTPase possibly involved in regulator sRNA degradation [Frankia canadensis]|uniref:GTPase possibly involved in regulator sRNA degradation n=1 Tax=Frankia canadensis TaxID=1836972 RepID=A0A2I2KN74_9ACTN|nr:RNase adapter RapZ [Frankia canadensis]SNQ47099.1 GTPase possibly involved in regulator sRNA degradation [Frankia canadensis]SOU54389.1 GTPase possibly involved in regulator sRNA degradation [Frankia canadensis]